MAPGRPISRRAVTNENDENALTTRVTRAKAATLAGQNEKPIGISSKKPLQAKKSAINMQTSSEGVQPRKRTALGDVSNVNKGEATNTKDTKKTSAISVGPLARAAAPTGVTKTSRTNSTRSILGQKDKSSANHELKRPASVTGMAGNAQKKRSTNSSEWNHSSLKEDLPGDENEEPLHGQSVSMKITETIKVTTRASDGSEVEKEVKLEENILRSNPSHIDSKSTTLIGQMDQEDEGDPLMVSEYVYEILDYMKELEQGTAPNPEYMDHQKHLEWRMRGVLVDWLLEVHTRFHLLPETLYLTINIIDRFLSRKVIQLERLQLVGITAMFIASKYEEVLSPHIGSFRHVADDGFTEEEILSAERYILATLNYDLSFPNPMHFMRRISKADGYDIHTRTLAKYLLEISLLDHRLLEYKPSLTAAAAMHLSRVILEKGPWDNLLVHYSGYTEDDIQPAVQLMINYMHNPIVHQAFYKKYAGKKFLKASLHARQWAKKWYEEHGDSVNGVEN